jgi:hypothetical protein
VKRGGPAAAAVRLVLLAALCGSLLAVSAEGAGSIGRVKFVKRADNICQPKRNDAKRRIADGTRLLTKKHPRVQAAGREFVRAYRQLRTGYHRVARLPRPGDDHRRIAKWLHRERRATAVGVQSAIALRRKHFDAARRLTEKAAVLEQNAARPVRNFDFDYCRPL